jgi:malate dehydrogenase
VNRRKITVIGAGHVGATTAQRLAERDYADVVLIDVVEGLAQGVALDLNQAGPVVGYEPNLIGADGYEATSGSDVCIVTSGMPRKHGMSRDDLLARNREIVGSVAREIADRSPDSIVIVVTNPLDAMCHVVLDVTGFSRQRVVGMAGILDTARFRTFLAWELGVSVRDVSAFVLGGHGDLMVPVVSYTNVAGAPVSDRIDPGRLDEIVERTRQGGGEIVALFGEGGAYHAPSAAVAEMVDSIVYDRKRVLPCAALCQGEFGIRDLFVGVPCMLGARGVEEIVQIRLSGEDEEQLRKSAAAVRELVEAMAKL